MPRTTKREIEEYYFERFRNAYSLPSGRIDYGDKPDVILSGEKKIGIEVTNFFRADGKLPESEQNQKRFRDEAIKKAQKQYLSDGGKSIELSFGFNKEYPIRNKIGLTKKVVELAKRIDNLSTGEVQRGLYENIPELTFVYVNSNIYRDPKWRIYQVYSTVLMSKDKLTDIIKAKEKKVKEYNGCDKYWLLVVIDYINPAQDQEIRINGLEDISSNVFEKIFVYRTAYDHYLEIMGKSAA